MIVRNHRKFLLGTVILLLLVLLIVLSVVFRNAFPSFLPVVTNPSIEDYSSSAPNDNVSPFYDIIGNIEEDTPEFMLDFAMKEASDFYNVNRIAEPSERPVIKEHQIVIEVVREGDDKAYKLIKSGNVSYNHRIGDTFEFKPKVNQDNLIIKDGNRLLKSSKEFPFDFPNDLELGDMVVFICQRYDCSDSNILWALVFSDY